MINKTIGLVLARSGSKGIKDKNIKYILNVSSDAVYADSKNKINEDSLIAPQGFHGAMHCLREYLLEKNFTFETFKFLFDLFGILWIGKTFEITFLLINFSTS